MTQAVPPHHGRDPHERPRWLVPALASAGVVVVAGVVVAVLVLGPDDGTAPAPAVTTTVVLPVPTPTVSPVAREATSAFATALPSAVLQFALESSAPDEDWMSAGALEAWSDAYTDGGSGRLTVQAGQWETPEEATAFAASLVGALPSAAPSGPPASPAAEAPELPASGDVMAGGAVVGTYTIVDAGDGTGIAVWSNGTAVFRLVAPVDEVVEAWAQYPL